MYDDDLNRSGESADTPETQPLSEEAIPTDTIPTEAAPAAETPLPEPEPEAVRFANADREWPEPAPGWSEMRFHQSEEPERPAAFSDAGYVPTGEAGAMPRSYHCAVQNEKRERKPREKKTGRGVPWAGLIAACLVCAILGGLAGGALSGLTRADSRSLPETEAAESSTVLNVAAPAATSNPTQVSTNLITDSREKTATELYYDLAVKQAVAITTEITYTNIWGYTVPAAVKGSGFVLSADGYILTNHHVIEDAVKGNYDVKVLFYDGTEYLAEVVGYEEDNDVAVLKIEATGLSPVTLGDSDQLKVGQQVYAVGNPLGELEFSMSSGMISATDREISTTDSSTGIATSISMFQIDAPINSGNSGGPIYNSRGEVIGIATAKYASSGVEGLGFAIPINDAISIAQDLITDGYVHGKASFGITVGTVTAAAAQYYGLVEGAIVGTVTEGSAADKAGLRESDIIVALDDKTVSSRDDLISIKKDYRAGDTVTLKVYRNGDYEELKLTFDEQAPVEESAETNKGAGTDDNNGGAYRGGNGGFFGGYPFG